MLSDNKIKSLKPKDKAYKISDRDGLYLFISKSGLKSFRFDYKFKNKRKTITIGRYPIVTLATAREILLDYKRLLFKNINPIEQKQKNNFNIIKTPFKKPLTLYFNHCKENFAPNTMRLKTRFYEFSVKHLGDMETTLITKSDILNKIKLFEETPTPQTKNLLAFIGLTYKFYLNNLPDDFIIPTTNINLIYKKGNIIDRYLTKNEIHFIFNYAKSEPNIYNFLLFLLQTMCRIQEALKAKVYEFDLSTGTWIIPKERMKNDLEHRVYLSIQSQRIVKKLIEDSRLNNNSFVFNQNVCNHNKIYKSMKKINQELLKANPNSSTFTPHDFRRTASTFLNEKGYNSDYIEALLSHKKKGIRAVYNIAEYKIQKTEILQEWADTIDLWIKGEK